MKTILILLAALTCCGALAQQPLRIPPGLNLPKDSLQRNRLLASLHDLLAGIEAGETAVLPFIAARDRAHTLDLIDEMRGMQQPMRPGGFAFSPSLSAVMPRADSSYMVQITYLSDTSPVARATFRLIAWPLTGRYVFGSPLAWHTATWKTSSMSSGRIHFRGRPDLKKAAPYFRDIVRFDAKLSMRRTWLDYYLCDDVGEALQMLGVDHKADYSGRRRISMSSASGDTSVVVAAFAGGNPFDYDPHDLWHSRLRMVADPATIHKPADEGCAFLYAGSWGMSWPRIFGIFLDSLGNGPQDWLKLYEANYIFYSEGGRSELNAAYVMNALIVQQIEKEQGFAPVMKLLTSGPYKQDNIAYFAALEALTGIKRENFNEEMGRLIRLEQHAGKGKKK